MLSRRHVLTSLTAAGVALATERVVPTVADARRLIVDSQIHMWPANTPERPWVAGTRPQLLEPFTIERVIPMLDEAGVDRVVIVPPTLEGERLGRRRSNAIRAVSRSWPASRWTNPTERSTWRP
jgi:hypothetical protein